MRIALIQTAPKFGAVSENLQKATALLKQTEADLWVLPELAMTGYQFRDEAELERLAEPADGPTFRALAEAAKDLRGHVVAGFPERDGDRIYNSAMLVGPDGLVGLYRKVHLFDREKELFDPGDLGFPVFDLGAARVGLMICFDWLFPEAARSLALAGAQVIAHPANLVLPYCQDAVVTRAIENRVFVATANRVGIESRRDGEQLVFSGKSRLVGPDGRVLLDGPAEDETVLTADVTPDEADAKNITPRNDVLADRRPDQYRS